MSKYKNRLECWEKEVKTDELFNVHSNNLKNKGAEIKDIRKELDDLYEEYDLIEEAKNKRGKEILMKFGFKK